MQFSELNFSSSVEAMLLMAAISKLSDNKPRDWLVDPNEIVQDLIPHAEHIYGEMWSDAAELQDKLSKPTTFEEKLRSAINKHSKENDSNTPDFILAEYLLQCLDAFNKTSVAREKWYGKSLSIENY